MFPSPGTMLNGAKKVLYVLWTRNGSRVASLKRSANLECAVAIVNPCLYCRCPCFTRPLFRLYSRRQCHVASRRTRSRKNFAGCCRRLTVRPLRGLVTRQWNRAEEAALGGLQTHQRAIRFQGSNARQRWGWIR